MTVISVMPTPTFLQRVAAAADCPRREFGGNYRSGWPCGFGSAAPLSRVDRDAQHAGLGRGDGHRIFVGNSSLESGFVLVDRKPKPVNFGP